MKVVNRNNEQWLVHEDGMLVLEIWDVGAANQLEITHYGRHETAIVIETKKPANDGITTSVEVHKPEDKDFERVIIHTFWTTVVHEHCDGTTLFKED